MIGWEVISMQDDVTGCTYVGTRIEIIKEHRWHLGTNRGNKLNKSNGGKFKSRMYANEKLIFLVFACFYDHDTKIY